MARRDRRRREKAEKKKKKGTARVIFGWILCVVLLLALLFVFTPLVGANVRITDGAMGPSLEIGDTVAVNRLAYLLMRPGRGDIIQFTISGEDGDAAHGEDTTYLRRVIALPGETVQIMDGLIYINGRALKESYTSAPTSYRGIASSAMTLSNDEYFVLADNRSNNFDSRDSTVGPITRDNIVGKAWLRILPLKKFGRINGG